MPGGAETSDGGHCFEVLIAMHQGARPSQADCVAVCGRQVRCADRTEPMVLEISSDPCMVAVCDGLGQPDGGAPASLALAQGLGVLSWSTLMDPASLSLAMADLQEYLAGTVPTECGTAVAGVALDGPDALVFHAGDSRVYRLTAKGPSRLTRDHSLVQTLLDSGTITPEAARIHPRRHQLLFGFGPVFSEHWRQRYASVCCVADRLAPSEAYLICSDGFVNAVSAQDMECLTGDVAAADLSALMERVIERARDNVSMCVVRQRRETAAGPAVGKP